LGVPLNLLISFQLRGPPESDDTLHDIYALYCGLIDRQNEDYHNFFHFSASKHAKNWLLHSLCFYFLLSSRAIWEEHRRSLVAGDSPAATEAVVEAKCRSIPRFLLSITRKRLRARGASASQAQT
jgi:hypothetical protein